METDNKLNEPNGQIEALNRLGTQLLLTLGCSEINITINPLMDTIEGTFGIVMLVSSEPGNRRATANTLGDAYSLCLEKVRNLDSLKQERQRLLARLQEIDRENLL